MTVGSTIAGKYQIIRLLGQGGFGSVFEAIQHPVGRRVAVKLIAPEHARDHDMRQRFMVEASAVASISHPSVVTLFDYGVDPDGQIYMVLEYIDGDELGAIMGRDGPLRPERVVHLGRQALAGLAEAHRRQIVHRDLKPANMMVVRDALGHEQLKILDFGIAKLAEGDNPVTTKSGIALGTAQYMSPEQALARGIVPATDQYALAVVLFEMLVGHLPYRAESTFELLQLHSYAPIPRFPAERAIPPALEAVVHKALSKSAEHRFSDVGAMARALSAALGGLEDSNLLPPTAPIAVRMGHTRPLPIGESQPATLAPPGARDSPDTISPSQASPGTTWVPSIATHPTMPVVGAVQSGSQSTAVEPARGGRRILLGVVGLSIALLPFIVWIVPQVGLRIEPPRTIPPGPRPPSAEQEAVGVSDPEPVLIAEEDLESHPDSGVVIDSEVVPEPDASPPPKRVVKRPKSSSSRGPRSGRRGTGQVQPIDPDPKRDEDGPLPPDKPSSSKSIGESVDFLKPMER